jgi:hypothetical protein
VELKRISYPPVSFDRSLSDVVQFVTVGSAPGTKVGIVHMFGYQIANLAGVINVFPYVNQDGLYAYSQIDRFMDALRLEKVTDVYLGTEVRSVSGSVAGELRAALILEGYRCVQVLQVVPDRYVAIFMVGPMEHWKK